MIMQSSLTKHGEWPDRCFGFSVTVMSRNRIECFSLRGWHVPRLLNLLYRHGVRVIVMPQTLPSFPAKIMVLQHPTRKREPVKSLDAVTNPRLTTNSSTLICSQYKSPWAILTGVSESCEAGLSIPAFLWKANRTSNRKTGQIQAEG